MGDSDLEQLVLRLTADVTGLKASLDAAQADTKQSITAIQSTLNGVQASVGNAKAAVLELAAALGVTLSIEAFKNFVQGSMEAILQMDRMSTRLGVSAESLYGLREAGEAVGVSLESIVSSVTRLERAIENASGKIFEAQGAFYKLGLNARDLRDLKPDEAFGRIADAISHLGSQSEKTKVTMELFGRGGMALAPMFEKGSEGIRAATEEAKKFGLTVNAVDAERVRTSVEAFRDLHHILEGLGNRIAVELATPLAAVAESLRDFIVDSGGISSIAGPAIQALIPVIKAVLNAFQGIVIVVRILSLELGLLEAAAEKVASILSKKVAIVGAVISYSKELIAADAELNHAESQLVIAVQSGDQARINSAKIERDAKKEALLLVKESVNAMALAARKGDPLDEKLNATMDSLREKAEGVQKALTSTTWSSEFVAQMGVIEARIKAFEDKRKKKAEDDANKGKPGAGGSGELDVEAEIEKAWSVQHKARLDQRVLVENEHYALMEADTKKHYQKITMDLDAAHKAGTVSDSEYLDAQAKNQADQNAIQEDFARKHAAKLEEIRLGVTQEDKNDLDVWLEAHKGSLNALTDAENTKYEKSKAILKEKFAKERTAQEEQNAIMEQLKQDHEVKLANIEKTQAQKQLEWEKMTFSQRAGLFGSMMGSMASLMNTKSREMFEIGKAAALAQAICDTAAAVVKAYKDTPGPPWVGAAMAAAVAVAGAVQIATIAGTSFGGGGSVSGGGGMSALPSTDPQTSSSLASQAPTINVVVPNDVIMDSSGVRKLMALINQQLQDGTRLATA